MMSVSVYSVQRTFICQHLIHNPDYTPYSVNRQRIMGRVQFDLRAMQLRGGTRAGQRREATTRFERLYIQRAKYQQKTG